jgi:7-hydroxymethyl chlorophyll a reductase
VDNGTREGLDKFLKAASDEPETVLHYEFMQDYKVCADLLFDLNTFVFF